MPITKSAKKALKGSKRKRIFNTLKKYQVNKAIKQFKKLVREMKADEAKAYMSQVQKILDKSVKTGLLKANTASRRKSRLSALLRKN